MEKRISFTDFQSIKAVAKAINPTIIKREKIRSKLEELAEEYNRYDTQIKTLSAGITNVIGVDVEDLVMKTTENGITKYVPTPNVTYDATKKEYVYSDGTEEISATEEAVSEEPVEDVTDFEESAEETVVDAEEDNNPFDI